MLKILIVDDTRAVHAFIKAMLAKTPDLEFTSVFNGQEAVTLLRTAPQAFDVILLDWEMPILTGPETFAEFQKMGMLTPVIMTTTKNAAADIEQMLKAGVAEYLMKPFTVDILVEKIEQACGKLVAYAA